MIFLGWPVAACDIITTILLRCDILVSSNTVGCFSYTELLISTSKGLVEKKDMTVWMWWNIMNRAKYIDSGVSLLCYDDCSESGMVFFNQSSKKDIDSKL